MDNQELNKSANSSDVPATATSFTPPPTANTSKPTSVSGDWPLGGFALFKYAKAAMKINLSLYVVLVSISILIFLVDSFVFNPSSGKTSLLSLPSSLIMTATSIFMPYATSYLSLKGVENTKASMGDILNSFKKHFLKYIVVTIGTSVALSASLLLFIIPFFIVWPRTSLWIYALIDNEDKPFSRSWNMMKGNSRKFYNIVGAQILVSLLIFTIIGIPFVIYWLIMFTPANALLYTYLKNSNSVTK